MKRLIFIIALAFSACGTDPQAYKDATLPVDERVESLLSQMTIEEKVGQMSQYVGFGHLRETAKKSGEITENNDAHGLYKDLKISELEQMTRDGVVGSYLHVLNAEEANYLQELAMESRLQIPLIIGIDAIHGDAMVAGTTVYPAPLTAAASFDLEAMELSSAQTAQEMRATGSQWTFTPNIDVARDARWGRVGETFGEDPYLVTQMGLAAIRGLQGEDISPSGVIACAKHLIAGGEPANGTNASPMDVSMRTLREVHLPPYKAAVEQGNVFTIMAAHNELNGEPCHASSFLMEDVIRGEYGFDGFFVSDWLDIYRIHSSHHVAPTLDDALAMSVNAGMDMNMHGPEFYFGVVDLVKNGVIPMKRIDEAVSKILEAKFRLGLFENPYCDVDAVEENVFTEEHQATALSMAENSIVLLKNSDNLLPLDLMKYNKILVTGPNANNQTVLGDWAMVQPDENVVTILEGIQEVAPGRVLYYNYGDDVRASDPSKCREASSLARSCDLAIVVVGENPLRYQNIRTTGENTDRMSLDLLGEQEELIKQIKATKVPTIVVMVGARPLGINWAAENVDAIVQAWEPGSFAGRAVANILTGKVNPSAKLPITIPRHSGQIQTIYNHKPSHNFHNYKDGPSTPLYNFGYGLSFTTFEYGEPTLSCAEISPQQSVTVSFDLSNSGEVDGVEVAQLYIRDLYSSVTRPVKELKEFARVDLKAGESRKVEFVITPEKLAFFNPDMEYVVEPGEFEIMVGGSSMDKDLKSVKLIVK